jgi:hypothetical protein
MLSLEGFVISNVSHVNLISNLDNYFMLRLDLDKHYRQN